MTFEQWINSSYNTDGYTIDTNNNYIQYPYDSYVYVVTIGGGGFSTASEVIQNGYDYGIES